MEINEEFEAVARIAGHDIATLRKGKTLESFFTIQDVVESKVLSRATSAQRAMRGKTFFDGIRSRQRFPQGYHDRGEAVAFADAEVCTADHEALARHYPIRVKAISAGEKFLRDGETWDLSEEENVYVLVNLGTLILEGNARVIVRGNVFSLVCQRMITEGESRLGQARETVPYDIGILAPMAKAGYAGAAGGVGVPGQGVMAVAAPLVSFGGGSAPLQVPLAGNDGGAGGPGGPGGRGGVGKMSKLAEITVRRMEGSRGDLVVLGQGGKGGTGGPGGQGGSGGAGAPGAYGGMSGRGGDGGPGGVGGPGGNGGIASNIYISVPVGLEDRIVGVPCMSEPGEGGPEGAGGTGGEGETAGHPGMPGRTGPSGNKGRAAPDMFINERRVEPILKRCD
jgi:hypothetical protein